MKLQDIFFLIVLLAVLFVHKPKLASVLGLVCLVISIPLFARHIFFTAERLTWYAAAFFLLSICLQLVMMKLPKKK